MIRVGGRVQGLPETQAGLRNAVPILQKHLHPAMRESLLLISRTAQRDYLSGPRPQKLGVVTNRLRGSLSENAPDNVFEIVQTGAKLVGSVGTTVPYGPVHEYGLTVPTKRGSIQMPKRAFMAPAEQDSTPAIMKRFEDAVRASEVEIQALVA